jgi:hypothetical protein
MSTITENDENDELIPVETPIETPEQDDEQDDEQEEDARLAESEDDHEDDVTSGTNRERRRKRRDTQKRAREAAQRELEHLRNTVAVLSQRVAATENHAVATNVQTLEQRLAQAQAEVQQAERIIAAATEAGNGNDVVAAMRIRDEAMSHARQLADAKTHFAQQRQQAAQPQVDPQVVSYAKEWMEANPWYDPQARDRDSALTKGIDNELVREGFNPGTRVYWEELTARVSEALGEGDGAPSSSAPRPRRKAPPTGNTREHAPSSTKKEIYVTPERKQAMIEAGVWDDPVKRQSLLRAYQAFDNGSAR